MKKCITERPEHFGPLFGYCDHQVQKLMNRQGAMLLRNVNEAVMKVFEVTGFSDILRIE